MTSKPKKKTRGDEILSILDHLQENVPGLAEDDEEEDDEDI